MKEAQEKIWLDEDGKLVKDGDPKASILFAAKGQLVPDASLEGLEVGSFFKDTTVSAAEPIHPGVRPEKFVPGQSNAAGAKNVDAPKPRVGPVKVIGRKPAKESDKEEDLSEEEKAELATSRKHK